MPGSVLTRVSWSAGVLRVTVSRMPARAGVLVRLPAYMPAATVPRRLKIAAAPAVSRAASNSSRKTKVLSRSPLRLKEAKKPGPLLRPMV